MQWRDTITVAVGISVGGLAAWLWHRVRLRLGRDDFWLEFASFAKCVVSDDFAAADFFKSYLFLLTRSIAHVGKSLFSFAVAFIPIHLIMIVVGPYAIEQWLKGERYFAVYSERYVTVQVNGESLIPDSHNGVIPLRWDPNVTATIWTEYCVLHSKPLTKKVAASSSAIDRLLFTALGFDVGHIEAQSSGNHLLVVRPSCGDTNVLWPYLDDFEFVFIMACILGSLIGWLLSRVAAK